MNKSEKYPVYDMNLIDGAYTELVKSRYIERHAHSFFEITIALEGTYVNSFDTGDIVCKENTMLIIRPRDIHYINPLSAVYRDIYVPVDKMKQLCNTIDPMLYDDIMEAKEPPCIMLSREKIDSCENMAKVITNLRISYAPEIIVPFWNILILKALEAYYESTKMIYTIKTPEWLLNMVTALNSKLTSTQNGMELLMELVGQSGYSHGHVCREFKKYYGCTLVQYINRQKMVYSTSLLLNQETTIAEIAQFLGYSNQSNYVAAFKSYYGESPSSWRKNKIKKT